MSIRTTRASKLEKKIIPGWGKKCFSIQSSEGSQKADVSIKFMVYTFPNDRETQYSHNDLQRMLARCMHSLGNVSGIGKVRAV